MDRLGDDVVLGEPLADQLPDQFARVAAGPRGTLGKG